MSMYIWVDRDGYVERRLFDTAGLVESDFEGGIAVSSIPADPIPVAGKHFRLKYVAGVFSWVAVDSQVTDSETRISKLEVENAELNARLEDLELSITDLIFG